MDSYSLTGADGRIYVSSRPGKWGGHRRSKIYGRLDCRSALRALANGGYTANRVFFADETTAVRAGYRPCARCLPGPYNSWRLLHAHGGAPTAVQTAYLASRKLEDAFGPLEELGAVVIGHSRDEPGRRAAHLLGELLTARDVEVRDIVDWPEQAASWLRPARRFTAPSPDRWAVLLSGHHGWERMQLRLRDLPWTPGNTVVVSTRDERPQEIS